MVSVRWGGEMRSIGWVTEDAKLPKSRSLLGHVNSDAKEVFQNDCR